MLLIINNTSQEEQCSQKNRSLSFTIHCRQTSAVLRIFSGQWRKFSPTITIWSRCWLDQEKLNPLLRLKYHNSIADALADLGQADEIGSVFSGFQKYLYCDPAVA